MKSLLKKGPRLPPSIELLAKAFASSTRIGVLISSAFSPTTARCTERLTCYHSIVVVPGLGTNPEECWNWKPSPGEKDKDKKAPFNWIFDPDGLASLYRRSRIMLYDFASAWYGDKKVRAPMKSICDVLLVDLKEKRKDACYFPRLSGPSTDRSTGRFHHPARHLHCSQHGWCSRCQGAEKYSKIPNAD